MGAVTFTATNHDYMGSRRITWGTITMSSAYTSGGDTYTPGLFGYEDVDSIIIPGAQNSSGDEVVLVATLPTATGFSATGGLLTAYGAGASGVGLTQIAANTNLSGYSGPAQVIGW